MLYVIGLIEENVEGKMVLSVPRYFRSRELAEKAAEHFKLDIWEIPPAEGFAGLHR